MPAPIPCEIKIDSKHRITYIGDEMFARDAFGNLKTRIVTIFPLSRVIVTSPPTFHGDQCAVYIDYLNEIRLGDNMPPLTSKEKDDVISNAVPLTIIEGDGGILYVIIRPDSSAMPLAYAADDILQTLLPKFRIFFIHTEEEKVRQAIRERGESWRIQTIPKSRSEMDRVVSNSLYNIIVPDRWIYYYNSKTGARYLTYENFSRLSELSDEVLREFLKEIQLYSPRKNRDGFRELIFFKVMPRFSSKNFARYDFDSLSGESLRQAHAELCSQFRSSLCDSFFQTDNYKDWDWLVTIYSTISGLDKFSTEEVQLGLCEEFALKINWLPGGRINENGGIIRDPVYTMFNDMTTSEKMFYEDTIPEKLIQTLVRESFLIEYVNIGYIQPITMRSESAQEDVNGPRPRRSVYIMLYKMKGEEEKISIIRLQKWGIREMLDEGKNLLESFNRAESYSDYVLNRRLACHLLQMELPKRLSVRRITEIYNGVQRHLHDMPIHTPYFEREYIDGIATYVITGQYFQNPKTGEEFSMRFAKLLGAAAAANLIVGRCSEKNFEPIFDEGDEVLQLDADNMPERIIVSEQPGTFVCYKTPLEQLIPFYADPINKRALFFPQPQEAAKIYVNAFRENFVKIQSIAETYRKAFDDLPDKEGGRVISGSMLDRWRCVLDRLRDTDANQLANLLRSYIHV